MWYIVYSSGGFPNMQVATDDSGDALTFKTRDEAHEYAVENLPCDWQIYKWVI